VHSAIETCSQLAEMMQVRQAVAVSEKYCALIVAALNDVSRNFGQDKAALARHTDTTAFANRR